MTIVSTDDFEPLRETTARRPTAMIYSELDTHISGLVKRLNAINGIRTIASCQGHVRLGKAPYVYFHASPALASRIEMHLRQAEAEGDRRLNTLWTLEGMFNEVGILMFRLHAPAYDRQAFTLAGQIKKLPCFRKKLNRELQALAEVIEEGAMLYYR
ncbi:hypothetical protein ACEV60_17165 [Enterobacter ludwigii]|uniref:hypothetical protein n=1 Tax=Enterobacter ludwigii TaxID=299767 RepID=UPI003BEEE417